MNRKNGIHFTRPSDQRFHDEHLARFRTQSLEELVALFNREVRVGITGVHMQLVYITTLNEALNERTGEKVLDQDGPMVRPMRHLSIVDGGLVQQSDN